MADLTRRLQNVSRGAVALACAASLLQAQQAPLSVERPRVSVFIRPYRAPHVPPARLGNSSRLHNLIRAGKLYLTVQDAIALAIENNLDLEVDRYGPLLADWQILRQEAGGALRGATSNSSQVGSVASGQGVQGTIQSAGLSNNNQGNGLGNNSNTVVQQIGPVAPNFDPTLQNSTTFSHTTTPFSNLSVAQTAAIVDVTHAYTTRMQQGIVTGGSYYIREDEHYLQENAPGNVLNPSVAPQVYLYMQHYLLQGFGTALNTRYIRVARKNAIASQETFRSQLLDLVANVLNAYWDVVSGNDELKARQLAIDVAQKFYDDTRNEIRIGVLAQIELPRAEVEVTARKQDLLISQANLRQRETVLKDALVRTPDPMVEAAEIVPLDHIEVPKTDDLPPFRQLVATAMAKRPDVAVAKIRDETAEISALGTQNSLLPVAIGYATTWNTGAAGTPVYSPRRGPDPYFIGGLGNAFGQVFRRNYPNERAGVQVIANINNRQAQGDYGIDQLQLKQSDLSGQRTNNSIVVDISRQMIALRQSRARYAQAVNTRELQEELLKAEQAKFSYGSSTISNVIVIQRALMNAQTSEVSAAAAYAHARVSLDQVLGETLEVNHVSMEQGLTGRAATK